MRRAQYIVRFFLSHTMHACDFNLGFNDALFLKKNFFTKAKSHAQIKKKYEYIFNQHSISTINRKL